MESSMMDTPSDRRGFVLVTVLAITAIALLFGAGAYMMFRNQCRLRVDRQHELEKLYAVRSAMNYVRTVSEESDIPDDGKELVYHTDSARDLHLLVKPVASIFPVQTNSFHFIMENGNFPIKITKSGDYSSCPDYEYGVSEYTNRFMSNVNKEGTRKGLAITDVFTQSNTCWWVNIGMADTGGWLQEEYGRRYYFYPYTYVSCGATQDVLRLCLIRNVTNNSNTVGHQHGWPLSYRNERALVFEITPFVSQGGNTTNNAEAVLYEYVHTGSSTNVKRLLSWSNFPSACFMGMQLAYDKVSLFCVKNNGLNDSSSGKEDDKVRGFTFSDTVKLSRETYKYFLEDVEINGRRYGGIYTNAEGRVWAPELRAVFEFERKNCQTVHSTSYDFLSYFRVRPAYQYDIFIENPSVMHERATVAQKVGTYNRSGLTYSMFTYDTHGTANKGFRKDERAAANR